MGRVELRELRLLTNLSFHADRLAACKLIVPTKKPLKKRMADPREPVRLPAGTNPVPAEAGKSTKSAVW
jgi:hypothetical protein